MLILALVLCLAAASRAADISVATATELSDAVGRAQPGDVVHVARGTYKFDQALRVKSVGTKEKLIRLEGDAAERPVLDFSAEPEDANSRGIRLSGEYWQFVGIEVAHAGSNGIDVTGNHNLIERCVTRENRNTGLHIGGNGSDNLIFNCESFRNFDPKTKGENADGFEAKHDVGPGNVFRGCRSYQNSDDGWDLWMATHPVLIEDCVAFRNGYNIWHSEDFQGDGNGFKFGGNYVSVAHVCRRCVSIENPLHGFDQNHNLGPLTIENCVAIRCGKGFQFPEVPRDGVVTIRNCTSFGCRNVIEPHAVLENDHWYADISWGNLGPPPRPGHRATTGAGEVPTTQEPPIIVPPDAPASGILPESTQPSSGQGH